MFRRCAMLAALWLQAALGQSIGTLEGEVSDVTGSRVNGASVRLLNRITGFDREVTTGEDGSYSFTNVPLNIYVLNVNAGGFASHIEEVKLLTNLPKRLAIILTPASVTTAVEVTASDMAALVDPEATGTRTELNESAIAHMPTPVGSRGIESVLVSLPGFAADANGAIHPRGAHNQMTYVIDGMPVTDQLTGAFANSVDAAIVQTVELYTGNVPAEYGSKVSGVAAITTKSGLGSREAFRGDTQLSGDTFETLAQTTQVSGTVDRLGYFASLSTAKSQRYLDQVSLDNLHNGGNTQRAFARLDHQARAGDQLRLNLMAGRSSFELANLRSQQGNGQDQRQYLADFSSSVGWLHTVNPAMTIDATASYRTAVARLFSSPGDTPVTATQARHLTTVFAAGRVNRITGHHTLRAGGDWQHFPVSEAFTFAITDAAFNTPGSPSYQPALAPYDLSRAGTPFSFADRASGNLYSAFGQDNLRLGRWMVSLGLRFDAYRFLAEGNQLQPRVGLAYHLRETGTVFRASYNRNYQTPPNENLLVSSSERAAVLVSPRVRERLGGVVRIRPERQNVYEAGVQQSIGPRVSVNASYYHKDSLDMQDNDNLFNTGIIFPTSLASARTNGAEARIAVLPFRGLSGSVSLTHYRTIVTPPFTGGLFLGSTALDVLTSGPFVIDHSQELGVHGLVQYVPRRGVWISGAVRHDSGLVSNPSDPAVVAADPDYYDLLPYVDLLASPARVRPRTVADVAVGYERLHADRRAWEIVFQVSNLFDTTALYNFQSIFVGTRLIQPRTAAVKLRWYF